MRVFSLIYLPAWVLIMALFSPVAAPASVAKLTTAEREYLNQKGSITFISQTSYPPFEFVDERFERTERRGMMIELAQWISSEFGFHARFIDAGFAEAQAAVLDGTADVLTSFFYSDKRNETFDFTQTIFPVPASIFVIANRTDINNIDDLRGKRIAMQQGDYARDFLQERNIPFTKVATRNFAEATTRVISGEADAVIGDEQIVLYYLYSNNLQQLVKIAGEPLYTGLNSMAVKDGNLLLQSILNKGIDHARATGMLERLNRKWLGTPLPTPEYTLDLRTLWPYGATILALLVAILVWNIQLRRTVAARTVALQDLTQHQQLLLDNIRTQIWYLTGEHQYGQVNQAHANFFGVGKDDLAFKDMYEVMPAEAVEICRISNSHIFNTGESTLTEELLADSNGDTRLLEIHKTPKLNEKGQVEYVVCSAEDITERKAAEAALKQKSDEMEQFVYIVSHDLKSPLVTIKTFLPLLQEDIHNGDQEQISANLAYINGATTKIESLLDALLQLSRVGNARHLPQDVATATLITDCLTALAGPLQQHQILVTVGPLTDTLHGDPLHFGQIWQNLIENAIKYRGNQTQPQIEIGCLPQGKEVVFFVRDNGMGIAAEHHQHIFGIFTQLCRSSEGTGLGLALVKKLVTSYQGQIWVESAGEGQGSCFKFTLPAAVNPPT